MVLLYHTPTTRLANQIRTKPHTMNQTKTSTGDNNPTVSEWITETINGGSFPVVDLNTGSNGYATPPSNVFPLRSVNYFKTKQKSPGGDYLLSLLAVDWLKSTAKLVNLMANPNNRVAHALKTSQTLNNFVFAINFQMPSKEHNSLVFYFATEDPIPSDSLLHRLINEQDYDSFCNERFKAVTHVEKGPRVIKALAGKFGAIVLGKTMKCSYHRGANYFEVDVDLGSYAIMATAVRFTLGYITSVTLDIGCVVEAQTEDELPEKLIGAVRLCQMDLSPEKAIHHD